MRNCSSVYCTIKMLVFDWRRLRAAGDFLFASAAGPLCLVGKPVVDLLMGSEPAAPSCTLAPAERRRAGKLPHPPPPNIDSKEAFMQKGKRRTAALNVCPFVCVWAEVATSGGDQWRGRSTIITHKEKKKKKKPIATLCDSRITFSFLFCELSRTKATPTCTLC